MTAKPGSMRLIAEGATCTRCGVEVPVSLDGFGALSQEEAFAEIDRQTAAHAAVCPAPKPAVEEAHADA